MRCLFIATVLSFIVYGIFEILEHYKDDYNLNCKLTSEQIHLIKMVSTIIGFIFGMILVSDVVINLFSIAQGELQYGN